ncbi:MAG TPA: hypothetical protein VE982_06435 [Gaiellaceae bacterium]|nr:hypothetical protein [Gaiellaceae bacterium]
MAEADVFVADVKALRTRSGNTRFVLVSDDGREFSTFREEVAADLPSLKGQRARVEFHEERRGAYTNVYLDRVEPLDGDVEEGTDPHEVAWRTAVDAAPYLLSSAELEREVPPEELFERLRPFKELVADDIARPDDEDA